MRFGSRKVRRQHRPRLRRDGWFDWHAPVGLLISVGLRTGTLSEANCATTLAAVLQRDDTWFDQDIDDLLDFEEETRDWEIYRRFTGWPWIGWFDCVVTFKIDRCRREMPNAVRVLEPFWRLADRQPGADVVTIVSALVSGGNVRAGLDRMITHGEKATAPAGGQSAGAV